MSNTFTIEYSLYSRLMSALNAPKRWAMKRRAAKKRAQMVADYRAWRINRLTL